MRVSLYFTEWSDVYTIDKELLDEEYVVDIPAHVLARIDRVFAEFEDVQKILSKYYKEAKE